MEFSYKTNAKEMKGKHSNSKINKVTVTFMKILKIAIIYVHENCVVVCKIYLPADTNIHMHACMLVCMHACMDAQHTHICMYTLACTYMQRKHRHAHQLANTHIHALVTI